MSVAPQILIAPQTAVATSPTLNHSASDGVCTVVATGLGSSETVSVQVQNAAGAFVNVASSPACQLTNTINTVVLPGPGIYQFVKSATAASVGVVAYCN